ncbi:tRNA(Ile)-lysidine synthetase [Acidothermus cellulolyticus 11B]|uniref:tRNA(Ile)-lysidine synthase n=1 Tax=Acidothermus cellulolyticus (strain ATCC 43068 / DSM 8971 / 11B) TaxID=351607 RepID=A0LRB6_ACIC1|nr:tRNA lysidine(34) synthetase TilS [Acidothermus cellulolyticus]ABK51976.1 tRNA(Ile)-lysidine synthetase [Acidothermus cellulolyticus 11B]
MTAAPAGRRPRLSPAIAAVRHAVRTCLADLPAGALVLAACSGGPDSLALAAALAFEAPRRRPALRAGAVTIDHQLQPGSAERARQLARFLGELGLDPVEIRAVQVGRDGGPEAAARAARYAALDEVAAQCGAAAVLLAHTLDDQAETVLLGLTRGSGLRSIAGMPERFGPADRYRRPLLGIPRSVTRRACRDAGLPFWDDPQNHDPAFTRSRLRHRVLPVLRAELGPQVVAALARTAALARADADALDAWAARVYARAVTLPVGPGDHSADDTGPGVLSPDAGGTVPAGEADAGGRPLASPDPAGGGPSSGVPPSGIAAALDVAALAAEPPAIRLRVIHRMLRAAGAPAGQLAAVHVRHVEQLISNWHGQGPVTLPGALVASRRGGVLQVRRERTGSR